MSHSPLRGITKSIGYGQILRALVENRTPGTNVYLQWDGEPPGEPRPKPLRPRLWNRLISQLYYRLGYMATFRPFPEGWAIALWIRGLHVQVGKRRF